jgi:hypothetical protein
MGQGYGMGPGMMGQGYGPGYGMGPGMMGPGYGPRQGYGPGASYGMGPGMMGPGYGMGYGPGYGMMGQGGMHGYGGRASIDSDGDGTIGSNEAAGFFEATFVRLDANDDGKLSPEEFATACFGPCPRVAWGSDHMKDWQDRKEARFKAMDTNGDNAVSQEEFFAYGKKRYEDSDRDKDGKVTVWEFLSRRYF